MSTAIITGASRGLGLALASELAVANWHLVIDARTESDLAAAARSLGSLGSGKVDAIAGDVSDPAHARRLVAGAVDLGGLSALVNNAGTLGPSPLPDLARYPLSDLEEVFRVNVVAPLRLIQTALPELRAARGKVMNVTSDAAVEGYQGWGGYGASKAALEQLSRVLAAEEPEIDVYWVDPGDMQTAMHQAAFPGEDISDRPLPGARAPALARLLLEDFPSGRYTAESLLSAASHR